MTGSWLDDAAPLPRAGDRQALETHNDRWRETEAAGSGAAESPAAQALLAAIFGNSPYLSRSLIADPEFARLLLESGPDEAFAAALAETETDIAGEREAALMKRLRDAKRRGALAIGVADIAAVWPLATITSALSRLAEAALRASCRHLLRAAHNAGRLALPDPADPETGSGLIILGMGKLGAFELNYSCDIDLIVLFDQDAAPCAGGHAPQQVFNRLVRRLVRIMDERTADGYVFRTDLRLRPDPSSTPPAMSIRAAHLYYESAGRNWERAAMIKARPVAGDNAAGDAFLKDLEPFVWRQGLDFAALQDMQAIKHRIDMTRGGAAESIAGRNVKLGRGGIREIEFFAQAQQLAWGGRNRRLRARGTVEALYALVAAGHVTRRAAGELVAAYMNLRGVEHRLQMVNDAQTQELPRDDEGMERFAVFMGYVSVGEQGSAVGELSRDLAKQFDTVADRYTALFEDRPAAAPGRLDFSGEEDDAETLETLSAMGFSRPGRVSASVRGWLAGRHGATRSERARTLLAGLAPTVLAAFAATPEPDGALERFDAFLARVPAGVRLFSLLASNPPLVEPIAEIMGAAPRLANSLTHRPELLESMLSRDYADLEVPDDVGRGPDVADAARRGLVRLFYAREFRVSEMRAQLAEAAAQAPDIQDLLGAVRRWANDRMFQIGVHALRGLLSPVDAARPLSDIADACIGALMPRLTEAFAARHGRIAGGAAAVAAFGELGSREMTLGSELDLLFIYDHAPGAGPSDGPGPLAPGDYYARLFRRLIAALAAPTPEGRLYQVDMRRRASGASGPVACSLAAFARYHDDPDRVEAHCALAGARAVYAEGDLGERFDAARRAALDRPRERAALAAAVAAAGETVRGARAADDAWSIEHMRGGLSDVRFAARFLQLLHARSAPEILAGDAAAVFETARERGLADPEAARELAAAGGLWRNLQGILRLAVGDEFVEAEATAALKNAVGRSCGRLAFEALVESISETANRAARHCDAVMAADRRPAAQAAAARPKPAPRGR